MFKIISLNQVFKSFKKLLSYLLINVIPFLIIFKPPLPFTTINPLHISGLISIIFLVFNINYLIKKTRISKVIFFLLILLFYQLYFVLVFLINSESLLNNISFLFWIIDVVPSGLLIAIICKKNSFKFMNVFINISLFQGILSLFSFIDINFKNFLINSYINYGYLEVFDLSSHRIFGLAANTTFTMPIFQSTIGLVLLFKSLKNNIFYLLPLSIVLFSAFVNSRASIVIFFFGSIIIILNYFLNLKFIPTIVISISTYLFLISFNYVLPFLTQFNPTTFQWIFDGLEEFNSLLSGNVSSSDYYFSYLFDDTRYILPGTPLNLLFGRGVHTYSGNTLGIVSDLGFINDIWLGGIFYILSFYTFVSFIIYKISNNFLKYRYLLITISFSILFLSNIKGIIFSENDIMNSLIIVYIIHLI